MQNLTKSSTQQATGRAMLHDSSIRKVPAESTVLPEMPAPSVQPSAQLQDELEICRGAKPCPGTLIGKPSFLVYGFLQDP